MLKIQRLGPLQSWPAVSHSWSLTVLSSPHGQNTAMTVTTKSTEQQRQRLLKRSCCNKKGLATCPNVVHLIKVAKLPLDFQHAPSSSWIHLPVDERKLLAPPPNTLSCSKSQSRWSPACVNKPMIQIFVISTRHRFLTTANTLTHTRPGSCCQKYHTWIGWSPGTSSHSKRSKPSLNCTV